VTFPSGEPSSSEIPWRQITAFRNVLAHGYAGLRLDEIWQVIVGDLSALRLAVDGELGDLG